jgi:hypothetical protein
MGNGHLPEVANCRPKRVGGVIFLKKYCFFYYCVVGIHTVCYKHDPLRINVCCANIHLRTSVVSTWDTPKQSNLLRKPFKNIPPCVRN